MKTEQLHDLWTSPDNSRLTTKQFSFRLPVHIAAKIAALCDIYPQKNRTQIVADLLTSSLDELEKNLPESLGDHLEPDFQHDMEEEAAIEGRPQPGDLYYLGGARGRFRSIANNHYRDLEKELGNENPELLYPNFLVTQSDLTKSK